MKIAFLNIYQGKVDRGGEVFVYELPKRLSKNFQVETIDGKRDLQPRWPVLWRFFIDPQGLSVFFWTLSKLFYIYKNKFDIVIPLNGGWQSALVRLTTWLYGGKMVISGHSGIGWDDRNNLWCFPDRFVALTQFQLEWAKKVNPLVRLAKIPNGIDLNTFNSNTKKLKLDLPRPIILCVAALDPGKRQDLAIKAVSKLNSGSLLLVGKGAKEKELVELGKKLLPNRFEMRSFLYHEMPKVYSACDLFTYPTVPWESFGLVLLEAMASNIPIVATDDPIRREIVGDAGLFVDPTDTDKYAEALEKALKTKLGNIPRKHAEKFDWDKIAVKYKKLFEELC